MATTARTLISCRPATLQRVERVQVSDLTIATPEFCVGAPYLQEPRNASVSARISIVRWSTERLNVRISLLAFCKPVTFYRPRL
jgi:hypothetical protein